MTYTVWCTDSDGYGEYILVTGLSRAQANRLVNNLRDRYSGSVWSEQD